MKILAHPWVFGLMVVIVTAPLAQRLDAQTIPNSMLGTEIFITMDNDGPVGSWSTPWFNITLRSPKNTTDILDLALAGGGCPGLPGGCNFQSSGFGSFGPLLVCGDYIVEPFWVSQTQGILIGNLTWSAALTFPNHWTQWSVAFQSIGIAPGHRRGIRIARVDGEAFAMLSLQYTTAAVDFLIGKTLRSWADFSGYQRITPTLGSSATSTMSFAAVPDNFRTIQTIPGAAATPVFNVTTGTFQISALVGAIENGSGQVITNTATDSLVGGTILVTGTYGGTDLTSLSDIVFNPATVTLTTVAGTDQLSFSNGFPSQPLYWRLEGNPAVFPIEQRPFVAMSPAPGIRTGQGSPTLNAWEIRLPFERITLRLRATPQGFVLHALEKSFAAPTIGDTQHIWSIGAGGATFAAVNMIPGSTFYNLFAAQPTGMVGSGPFFGLDFAAQQMAQILLPLGTAPIHDQPNSGGAYFWGIPQGSIPAGLTVDVLLLEIRASAIVAHAIQRLAF